MVVLRPEDIITIFNVDLDRVDCAGLRLTLHSVYEYGGSGFLGLDVRELPSYREISCDPYCELGPGTYFIRYNEYVKIPNGYMGLAIPRSSLIRMGATIYTAVWDPGYEGRGAGMLVVFNPYGIRLEKGVQVAQLVLFKMSGETKHYYRGVFKGEK